jgi:hypothetical protein
MIKSAHLYKEQLEKKIYESWYSLQNQYWNGSCSDWMIKLSEDNWSQHQFVTVDKNDNVTGYITYSVDHQSLKAYCWGIISFVKGNLYFAQDLYQAIHDIFYKYNLNKIEFCAYTDNPVINAYRNFIGKVGGTIIGIHHESTMLLDHKLHDTEEFEIMKVNFKPINNWRFNK